MSFFYLRFISQQVPSVRPETKRKSFSKNFPKIFLSGFGFCFYAFTLVSCVNTERYMETHDISHLKVVFLDDQSLQDLWETKTGEPGIQFQPWLRGDLASVKTVRGFYDFATDTLYCPKWNYEVCGHELHHAALGHFHPND